MPQNETLVEIICKRRLHWYMDT